MRSFRPSSHFSPISPQRLTVFFTNSAGSDSLKLVLIGLDEFSFLSDSKQMQTLQEAIKPTTFIESSKLRDYLGLDLTIASETFQHTGSFKFRAAYNLALNIEQDEVLTASSRNFGQALAY